MYEELVKGLRDCAEVNSLSLYKRGLMKQAADALEELQKRVPPVPHGRLVDADAIRADIDEKRPGRSYDDAWALTVLDSAPTILEAEEGE